MKANAYKELGLNDQEYQRILSILKREPTPTELAMFSVEWSEHCGYPRSRKWLKLFPQTGKYESLVGEDAGGAESFFVEVRTTEGVENREVIVNVKEGGAQDNGGGFDFSGNSTLWIIGIVNVILIVLIIIVAVRVSRR